VDHLIHALVKEMLPAYVDRHKQQMLGMQGPDLGEKHRKEILACAPETPLERIKEINQSHFQVQSMSSENIYEVNLLTNTCTCSDFPRIQLCKHIAATVHFFGGEPEGELGPRALDNASVSEPEPDVPKSPAQQDGSAKTRASIISVVNDITRLAQEFLEIAPVNPETVKSLKMARSQLNAARLSMDDNGSRLPEKEQIAPNQLSWPPTAARMGVKRGEKRRRGKVDSALTAEHIGAPKRKHTSDDPYGAGESSGKRAKSDAVSAAANARARAAKEKAAERPPPASLPARLSPSPAPYAQMHPVHAPSLMQYPVPVPTAPYPYSQYPYSQPVPHFTPTSGDPNFVPIRLNSSS
jgi:hypothetical protein